MRIACSISSLYFMGESDGGSSKPLKGVSPERNLPVGYIPLAPKQETPHAASYARLDHLASTAPAIRLGLHPTRTPPVRRVGHRLGPERRGAHHHPVGRRHRADRR